MDKYTLHRLHIQILNDARDYVVACTDDYNYYTTKRCLDLLKKKKNTVKINPNKNNQKSISKIPSL